MGKTLTLAVVAMVLWSSGVAAETPVAGEMVTVPTAELVSTFTSEDKTMPKTFRIGNGFQKIGDYIYVSLGGDRIGGGIIQYFKWDPKASGNQFTYVGEVSHSTIKGGFSLCAVGNRLYALALFVWGAGLDGHPETFNAITWFDIEKETGKPIEKGTLPGIVPRSATFEPMLIADPEGKNLYVTTAQDNYTNRLTWVKLGDDGKAERGGDINGLGFRSNPKMSPDGKHIYCVGDHNIAIVERKPSGEIVYKKSLSLDCLAKAKTPNVGNVEELKGNIAGISPDGRWVYVVLTSEQVWTKNCFGIFKRDPATGELEFSSGGSEYDKEFDAFANLRGMNLMFAPDGVSGFISSDMHLIQNFKQDPKTGKLSNVSDVVTPALKGRPTPLMVYDAKAGYLIGAATLQYEAYGGTWLGVWAAKTGTAQVRRGERADLTATTAAAADAKPGSTEDWPRWLGPNGDGKSTLKGIRKDWTGGLRKVWEVSGLSPYLTTWSPPSVQGEKLVVLGKHGCMDEVLCFNADTGGAPLWIAELPGDGGGDGWAGGPVAQPCIDGDRVYVCHATSRYSCLSMADGRLLWKKAFAQYSHTPGNPPVVWEDLVILTHVIRPETNKRSTLSAFKKDTGEWVWSYGEDSKRIDLSWTGALSLKVNGQAQLVYNTAGFAVGLDPRTGKPLWELVPESVPSGDFGMYTDPLTDGKTVVLVSANAKNEHVRSAVQIENGIAKELWKNVVAFTGWTNPVLHDGYLYTFVADGLYSSVNSGFQCVDVKTGVEKWSEKKIGCGSIVEVDGNLLCLKYSGDLLLLNPTPEGFKKVTEWKGAVKIQPWWTHRGSPAAYGGAPCWTIPVIARGKVYLRYNDSLACYDLMK